MKKILMWFNLVCSTIMLLFYIYTPQENEQLGILSVFAFLLFMHYDYEINRKL